MRFSTRMNRVAAYALALATTVALTVQVMAEPKDSKATVTGVKGSAEQMKPGGTGWVAIKKGDQLTQGTTIKTGADGSVDLNLNGVGVNRVAPNSVIKIDKLTVDKELNATETELDLKAGNVIGQVNKLAGASKYQVKTATGVAGIRGTVYSVYANGMVYVSEGTVEVTYKGVKYTVKEGEAFVPKPDGSGGDVVKMDKATADEMARQIREVRGNVTVVVEGQVEVRPITEVPLSGGTGETGGGGGGGGGSAKP